VDGEEKRERGHTYTPDNGGADRLVAEEMKQSKSVGKKERGHTYTPDNGGADRLVAEEMKQSKSVGMLEGELGA
jgi:ribonuclease HI